MRLRAGASGCSNGNGVTGPPASNAAWSQSTGLAGNSAVVSLLTSGSIGLAGTEAKGIWI